MRKPSTTIAMIAMAMLATLTPASAQTGPVNPNYPPVLGGDVGADAAVTGLIGTGRWRPGDQSTVIVTAENHATLGSTVNVRLFVRGPSRRHTAQVTPTSFNVNLQPHQSAQVAFGATADRRGRYQVIGCATAAGNGLPAPAPLDGSEIHPSDDCLSTDVIVR